MQLEERVGESPLLDRPESAPSLARRIAPDGEGETERLRVLILEGDTGQPTAHRLLEEGLTVNCEVSRASLAEVERDPSDLYRFDVLVVESARTTTAVAAIKSLAQLAPDRAVLVLADDPCEYDRTCLSAIRAGAEEALIKNEVSPAMLARALRFAIERKQFERHRIAQLEAAREAHRRAELARLRASFAASASASLASSLDLERTLNEVTRLATDGLADFCILDLLDGKGSLQRVAITHRDPALQPVAQALLELPLDSSRPHLTFAALQSREPIFRQISLADLQALAQNPRHLELLRQLGPGNFLTLPLIARDRLLGAILFARSEERGGFDPHEIEAAQDLAERAALAIDNARLYSEARDAIGARDSVLRIVAHDLRNPLNAIAMTANLLIDLPTSPEQLIQRANIIRRSAERMNLLIQDLLEVARFDAGYFALQRRLTSPADLARQTVETNAPLADSQELKLTCDAEPDLPPIEVDSPRVLQVLGNLVDNAIKFTRKGGEIRVEVRNDNGSVRFSVRDTGIGMTEDELGDLFRPFWQARRSSGDGAGLGLAISKVIVEAHDGKIWAESTQGQGSTFHISFPVAPERRRAGRRSRNRGAGG